MGEGKTRPKQETRKAARLLSPLRRLPFFDRSGRFSSLKTAVFLLLLAPAAALLWQGLTEGFGPRPWITLNHQTGRLAVRLLLVTLALTPLQRLFRSPRFALIRRQCGLAAAFYTFAHVFFYCADEAYDWGFIAAEILNRFYLTLGFVSTFILALLAATSTDRWLQRLGRRWRSLHRLVYPALILALWHFLLSLKADVTEAVISAGFAFWLLLWRLLPRRAETHPGALFGLTVAAAVFTAGLETLWYATMTRFAWQRVLLANFFPLRYGVRPADTVLLSGLLLLGLLAARSLEPSRAPRPLL
jgi:sulfoxide reductase heme-binding subunit YedZ